MKTKGRLLPALLLACAAAWPARARDLTAFQLVKAGNQYVGVQSKDKVVQIRSEKSVGSLTPDIWYVVYYDPDATFKSVQVKFGAGQEMEVTHPWRVLEMATDAHTVMDRAKLKVDSDRALAIAKAQPLLKHLDLKAAQLCLQNGDEGPRWKVEFWAAKLKNPNDQADVGAVYISPTDGSVIENDLHPDKVD